METVNIHEAKTHLSRLLERVAKGGGFIIAKAGKPLAKVVPLNVPDNKKTRRLGFLKGELKVPEDFDQMGQGEVEALFGGQS